MSAQRTLVPIVEGEGEEEAAPVLLRRLLAELGAWQTKVASPIRCGRQRIVRSGELERYLDLAVRRGGSCCSILLLLDSDDDCPAELGPTLLQRARAYRPDISVAVVLAEREYESWFLAAAPSLSGHCGLKNGLLAPAEPHRVRGAKQWLDRHMEAANQKYKETVDQAKLTARMDLEQARSCASFKKLCHAVSALCARP